MTISELKKDAREKLKGHWSSAICIIIAYSLFTFLLSFVASLITNFSRNAIIAFVLQILLIIISLPLSFGLLVSMVKLYRGEKVGFFSFVSTGFSNIYNAWKVFGRTLLKLALPVFLIIITYIVLAIAFTPLSISLSLTGSIEGVSLTFPIIATVLFALAYIFAIVKSLYYVLGNFILCDNSELTGKEIVEKSAEMMTGNRKKYFLLILSFIGWALLIVLVALALLIGLFAIIANTLRSIASIYLIVIITFIIAMALSLVLSCYISFSAISFYEDLNDVIPTSSSINQSGSAETITENTIE